MALRIVWRNPVSLIRNKPTLNRVRRDQFGTVYVVTYSASLAAVRADTERSRLIVGCLIPIVREGEC